MIVSFSHFLNIYMGKVEFSDWWFLSNTIFLSSNSLRIRSDITRAHFYLNSFDSWLEACKMPKVEVGNYTIQEKLMVRWDHHWSKLYWLSIIRLQPSDLIKIPGWIYQCLDMIVLLIQWCRNLIFASILETSEPEGVVSYLPNSHENKIFTRMHFMILWELSGRLEYLWSPCMKANFHGSNIIIRGSLVRKERGKYLVE